ncbi:MAG: hypothetical protein OQK98_08435 [Gammaproteobacteria bacterium]|nr:hypothetical protein [Gammaproteobacteria bacterium]
MDIYNLFALIAATFTGATMGSFLLVTLLYNTFIKSQRNLDNSLFIYRRLYRLNSVLCLLAGICAALIKNQSAAFMLTILTVSYVFNHSHILKGILNSCNEDFQVTNDRTYRSLSSLQNLIHLCQFGGAGYAVYLLALHN